jgi:hypothetical protein
MNPSNHLPTEEQQCRREPHNVARAALFVNASTAGFEPLPLAHLIGGAAGLLVARSPSPFARSSTTQPKERAS